MTTTSAASASIDLDHERKLFESEIMAQFPAADRDHHLRWQADIGYSNPATECKWKGWQMALGRRATTTSGADERAAFEAWYAPRFAGGEVANMPRRANGEYVRPQAEIAWQAFRAALNHRATTATNMLSLSSGLPSPDDHDRVLVYTEGVDFAGEQYFDIKTDDLWEQNGDRTEVAESATHWMPLPLPLPRPVRATTAEQQVDVAINCRLGGGCACIGEGESPSSGCMYYEPPATTESAGATTASASASEADCHESCGHIGSECDYPHCKSSVPTPSRFPDGTAKRMRDLASGLVTGEIKQFEYALAADCIRDLEGIVEQLRADLRATVAQQSAAPGDDATLRQEVSTICQLLDDGEWAEHIARTRHGQHLETAITRLVGKVNQGAAHARAGGSDAIESVLACARRVYTKFGADSDWSEWKDLGDALAEMGTPASVMAGGSDARDAARYRWLREGKHGIYITPGDLAGDGDCDPVAACIMGEIADRAIDAAMSAAQTKGGEDE